MANATSTQLQELYVAYFGRAADPTGLDYWTEKGITTAKFAADMYVQAEFKDAYGSLTTEAQVNQIYKNLFDREADVTGLTYWTQQINLGNLQLAEIANDLIWAAQNNSGSSDDKTALANKTSAAIAYTAKVKETTAGILAYAADSTSPWVSGDNITEAVTYLSGINKTTTHTAAGVATSVSTITTNGVPTTRKTFNLTTKQDTFVGGDGADVFNAADTSFALVDSLNGGAGTDRLNYVDSSNGGGIPLTQTSNIETFYIRNIETTASEIYDFSLTAFETEVWTDRSIDKVSFTNVGKGTTIGLAGDGSTVLGAVDFQMATATDAVALAIKGGVGAVGTAPAITEIGTDGTATSVTITSTGAANTVGTVDLANETITSATVTATTNLKGDFFSESTEQTGTAAKITISGEATSVEFTAELDDTIKTIDASGLTSGGLTATLGNLSTQSFTGGGGNDVITTSAAPTTGTIAAGAGTDKLILGAASHMDTATEAAIFTGFETLQTTGSFNMSLLSSIEKLEIGATSAATSFTNLSDDEAKNIQIFGAVNSGGISFAGLSTTGTSDVLTIKVGNDFVKTGTVVTTDDITFNGYETLNLEAVHGASAAVGSDRTSIVVALTSDKATAVNLTGTAFSVTNAALTKAATYDASALTGDGTVAGSKGLDIAGSLIATSVVKGSEFIDTVTIPATGSTYNLNGGADVVTATQANLAASVAVDGGAGSDNLKLNDADVTTLNTFTITDNSFANTTNFETITVVNTQAGDITWNLGGYANAMATAAGGTLKAVINADAGSTADIAIINASTLSGTNSLDLTYSQNELTVAVNAGTDTFTGSDGNDKFTISYNANHSNSTSISTISMGAGDDTVVYTRASAAVPAAGGITIDGGAGNDTITGSVQADTITGGLGTDTMTGGAGADIFVISTATHSNAATAGAIDKITDFEGAATDDLKTGTAGGNLRSETLSVTYTSVDTIAELNALLNSNNGTSTAKFDGTGGDLAKLTTSDDRILLAQDKDASGTFTAADIVVEFTGVTGAFAATDVIV